MKLTRTLHSRLINTLPVAPAAYAASDMRFNDNQLDRAIANEVLRFAQGDRYALKMYRKSTNI